MPNFMPTPADLSHWRVTLEAVGVACACVVTFAIFLSKTLDWIEDHRAKAAFRRDHQRAIQRPPTPLRLIAERRRLDGCDRKAQLDAIVRMGGSR